MAALTMTRGDSATITVTVVGGDGEPVDLTGKTLRFTAKASPADAQAEAIIAKSTDAGITHQAQTGATEGLADVTIDPADTVTVAAYPVAFVYDVQLTDGANTYTTETGSLVVRPDITTP